MVFVMCETPLVDIFRYYRSLKIKSTLGGHYGDNAKTNQIYGFGLSNK